MDIREDQKHNLTNADDRSTELVHLGFVVMIGNRLGGPVPMKTTDELAGTYVPVFRTADEAALAAKTCNVEEWYLETVCRMSETDAAGAQIEEIDEDEEFNGTIDAIKVTARAAVTRRIAQAVERCGEHIVDQLAQLSNHDPWSAVIRECVK